MSLNWSVADVRAYKQLHDGQDQGGAGWLITDSLIWASLFTGMGTITAENWREVYVRTKAAHTVLGMHVYRTLSQDGSRFVEQHITPGMVRRRIGLRTNVSKKTDAQFKKWLGETALSQAKDSLRISGI
jgi:hypothetical protein